MVNYFDGILGGIGALLTAGAVTAALTQTAVIIAFALLAAVLIGHALFLSPLAREPNTPQKQTRTQFAD